MKKESIGKKIFNICNMVILILLALLCLLPLLNIWQSPLAPAQLQEAAWSASCRWTSA